MDNSVKEGEIKGHWTMIYNEGFAVEIDGLRYFAFSK